MKQSYFTTAILRAEEGMWLTQAGEVAGSERVFAREVALGRNDVPANWREISDGEKRELERERPEIN